MLIGREETAVLLDVYYLVCHEIEGRVFVGVEYIGHVRWPTVPVEWMRMNLNHFTIYTFPLLCSDESLYVIISVTLKILDGGGIFLQSQSRTVDNYGGVCRDIDIKRDITEFKALWTSEGISNKEVISVGTYNNAFESKILAVARVNEPSHQRWLRNTVEDNGPDFEFARGVHFQQIFAVTSRNLCCMMSREEKEASDDGDEAKGQYNVKRRMTLQYLSQFVHRAVTFFRIFAETFVRNSLGRQMQLFQDVANGIYVACRTQRVFVVKLFGGGGTLGASRGLRETVLIGKAAVDELHMIAYFGDEYVVGLEVEV